MEEKLIKKDEIIMGLLVPRANTYTIPLTKRQLIAKRYQRITRAINREFWNSESDTAHSLYVGSYGRGTAISTSDIDIIVELPMAEFDRFKNYLSNGPSKLLQVIKNAFQEILPNSDIRADGQVVKINFHDGIKFEIVPAFNEKDYWGESKGFIYPDSNMGGNWKATNPKKEQEAMKLKNTKSNNLLYATCKHFRHVRDTEFTSYHLSGIVIDSFVYEAMGNWKFVENNSGGQNISSVSYETALLEYYNSHKVMGGLNLYSPGSNQFVNSDSSIICLEKVLKK
ncbi:SMODS domain-containing nucleotidyltransferase [Enterococcus faecium]|nr:nucleotidyltransferase domain-containing protein [Enterococcus faecium]